MAALLRSGWQPSAVYAIIQDLPAPQEPDMPIEVGLPAACVIISATVAATPEKFRKSRSASLSGHILPSTLSIHGINIAGQQFSRRPYQLSGDRHLLLRAVPFGMKRATAGPSASLSCLDQVSRDVVALAILTPHRRRSDENN